MNSSPYEELPLETIERLTDYLTAGAYKLKGRHGFRIPSFVVTQWVQNGFAVLRTNTLAKKYGVGRRTMWETIKRCEAAGFIKCIGFTDAGKHMWVPVLERGDEWRAEHDARMAAHVER